MFIFFFEAFDHQDQPVYHAISTDGLSDVKEFEYYHDYVFHCNRIKEICFSKVISKPSHEEQKSIIKNTEHKIISCTNEVVFGETVMNSIEMKLCEKLLYLNDKLLTVDLIEKVQQGNGKIIVFDLKLSEVSDFSKKYGSLLSILRYPMDTKNLKF